VSDKPLPSLRAADPANRPVVDVFDHQYRLNSITRTVNRALHKADVRLRELVVDDGEDGDRLVEQIANMLDALLTPTDSGPAVKKVVMEKWKTDALDVQALRQFSDDLQEQAAQTRPT
jgi:hypothetical protein